MTYEICGLWSWLLPSQFMRFHRWRRQLSTVPLIELWIWLCHRRWLLRKARLLIEVSWRLDLAKIDYFTSWLITWRSSRLVILQSCLRWWLSIDELVEVVVCLRRFVEVVKLIALWCLNRFFLLGYDGLSDDLGLLELWLLLPRLDRRPRLSGRLFRWGLWVRYTVLNLGPHAFGANFWCLSLRCRLLSLCCLSDQWLRCRYLDRLRRWHACDSWLWFWSLYLLRLELWHTDLARWDLRNLNYGLWILEGCCFLEAIIWSFLRHVIRR